MRSFQSFVSGNNMYYQADPSSAAVQLTDNGDEKFIFNGVPDWLYEGTHLYMTGVQDVWQKRPYTIYIRAGPRV